jgi:hypothetical protein
MKSVRYIQVKGEGSDGGREGKECARGAEGPVRRLEETE